jgi:glycerophosphoryl diester phosphodiesterase
VTSDGMSPIDPGDPSRRRFVREEERPGSARRPLWLAHRGDHRRHRENTLGAFRAALGVRGVDGIELDVRAARDGRPVVLHDPTLTRVFGVAVAAADLTGDELGRLGVPSLGDVLAAVPPAVFIDVELKEDVAAAAIEVMRASGRGPATTTTVISSFETDVLRAVAALAPAWPRWLNADDLSDGTVGLALELGCSGASVALPGLRRSAVAEAGRIGLAVAAWTVRTTEQVRALDGLDLVAVCAEGDVLDRGAPGPAPDQPGPG